MTAGRTVRRRVGGRSARVQSAVRDAVSELLVGTGANMVSVAAVAARSGVHPTSIYRRWGTPQALVLDVAVARLEADLPIPNTGTLRGDLHAFATQAAAHVTGPEGLALVQALLIVKAGREGPNLSSHLQSRRAQIQEMLDRASQRGETELVATDVIDHILGPIYMRTLFAIGGLDGPYLTALVERMLAAPMRRR